MICAKIEFRCKGMTNFNAQESRATEKWTIIQVTKSQTTNNQQLNIYTISKKSGYYIEV